MQISVKIRNLNEHTTILRKQKAVAEEFVAQLDSLKMTNYERQTIDAAFIEKNMKTVRDHLESITRRLALIEWMADAFSEVAKETDDIFSDAKGLIRRIDLDF